MAMIKYLLKKGADINGAGPSHTTPLMQCVGIMPSYAATAMFSPEQIFQTARFLIANGAKVDVQDGKGWDTLMYATHNHSFGKCGYKTIKLLIDNGASLSNLPNLFRDWKITAQIIN